MAKLTRRSFFKLGAAAAGILALGEKALGNRLHFLTGALKLGSGGADFSPATGKGRTKIPSACWQCVSRDAISCYVEDGRLVKIEGNEESIRNRGKICSKGQSGLQQVYDPDRILYPLLRTGKRGEGKWKRISWDEALDLLVNGGDIAGHKVKGLKKLRDEGHPEQFMFHYGRMKGSDSKMVKDVFLAAYGTGTVGNHTSICEGGKWTGQELTWGKHYEVWDFENTNLILNFGSSFLEAHTSHIQAAQRAVDAMANRNVKLYTFDVRLSNTAARSTEWLPVKPGTDLAVMLAMANVIMQNDLYDQSFIDTWTNVTVPQLKDHLKQYTPAWAEKISGVPAAKIERIALEFARAKPGVVATYRGAVAHYNGVQTERAKWLLEAICGYIDAPGGSCVVAGAKWKYPKVKGKTKKLKVADGFKGAIAYPTHHANHQVLKVIKDGKAGRPHIYMIYCYNPVYVNGDCGENAEIMKDEKLMPFIVNVNPFLDESGELSDLILPDVTYLERWTWEDMVSFGQIPEFYIRQPVVKPLGEARQFQDVCVDLAKRMGLDLGYSSAEDYVKKSCEMTGLDFEYMKKHGVWHDPEAKPKYRSFAKKLKPEKYSGGDVIFDGATGVYWDWKKSKAKTRDEASSKGYTATKNAYKGYVGQRIGGTVFAGFKPDKINRSGKIELYSKFLEKKGFAPMPSWMAIPEHQAMGPDDLILTTYKVAVQTHSRTQNNKWLTEIYHDNPALINPRTAAKRGIKHGSKIKVKSPIGEITTEARLTEGVHPGVIAISYHCGHWEYGEYASGKEGPVHVCERDCHFKWWKKTGVHPNWIIPNVPDPIAGQQRWMDTVVSVEKA